MTTDLQPTYLPGALRLDTLTRLRWLAIAGQAAAVLVVYSALDFPLPIHECLALTLLSVFLNVALRLRYPPTQRLDSVRAGAHLAYDILQLAALLYLTGGLENPFAFLFLAPVMVSATSLTPAITLALGILAMICATVLTRFHLPLPWAKGEALELPLLYVGGMWFSVLLGLAFIGVYTWRVAEEARLLSNALAATELALAREQHLTQLDGLAAAAAHELGTPLATIALVAKELEAARHGSDEFVEDVRLLRSQVTRCREILGKLTSLGQDDAPPFDRMTLEHLFETVVAPHRDFGVEIAMRFVGEETSAPHVTHSPAMIYGLGNIVENAVDFAASRVMITARWDARSVGIEVMDDGPGFPGEVMARLGEPYVTRRRRQAQGDRALAPSGGGLGLGFFIAKTLLERSGAQLSLANRAAPETGAVVNLTWQREVFER